VAMKCRCSGRLRNRSISSKMSCRSFELHEYERSYCGIRKRRFAKRSVSDKNFGWMSTTKITLPTSKQKGEIQIPQGVSEHRRMDQSRNTLQLRYTGLHARRMRDRRSIRQEVRELRRCEGNRRFREKHFQ